MESTSIGSCDLGMIFCGGRISLVLVTDLFIFLIGRVFSVLFTRFGVVGDFGCVLLEVSILGIIGWGFCAIVEFGLLILFSILGRIGEGGKVGEESEMLVATCGTRGLIISFSCLCITAELSWAWFRAMRIRVIKAVPNSMS